NSMGGAVAITIGLEHPERVRNLVLMAPGGLEDRDTYMAMRGIRKMIKTLYSGEPLTRDAMRSIFELQLHDPSLITDELIEERFQIAERQPRGLFEKVVVPDQRERLGELQAPILGFWGVEDQFCPVSGAMTIARRCKRTRMTMLSECGHWVMVEYRDLFNRETIQFLQEQA
ncbi:MAG: 3-oxoacyl-ACP reductase, partial [Candidatus Dadabacteria bacterium]